MAKSLADVARELDLDPAVLRRWIRREHIELLEHPTDHRRRMISDDAFEYLCRERDTKLAPPSADTAASTDRAIGEQVEALRSALNMRTDAANAQIAAMQFSIDRLNTLIGQLEARLSESAPAQARNSSTLSPRV
jgi:hypothetical protein